MEPGIWLGKAEESDEHLVATLSGAYRCRTIRRMLPDQRSNKELLVGFKGAPLGHDCWSNSCENRSPCA